MVAQLMSFANGEHPTKKCSHYTVSCNLPIYSLTSSSRFQWSKDRFFITALQTFSWQKSCSINFKTLITNF